MSKTKRNWMKIITTCRESGLSDRQWCIENGVPTSTFYYHVNKLRKIACNLPAAAGRNTLPVTQDVVQLHITEDESQTPPDIQPAITLQVRGISIDISNHANPDIITATIQSLVAIC